MIDIMIWAYSNRPHTYKLAGFKAHMNGIILTPMTEGHQLDEANIIKQLATNTGYSTEMIDRMTTEARKKHETRKHALHKDRETTKVNKFFSLRYTTPTANKI